MTTAPYTIRPITIEEAFGDIELHLPATSEFVKVFGAKVRAAGGNYTTCRGHSSRRYVTISTEHMALVDRILRAHKAESVILRRPRHLWLDLTGVDNGSGRAHHRASKDIVLSKFAQANLSTGAGPVEYISSLLQSVAANPASWARAEELRLQRIEHEERHRLEDLEREREARLGEQAPKLLAFAQAVLAWHAASGDPTLNHLLPMAREAVAAVEDISVTLTPAQRFAAGFTA